MIVPCAPACRSAARHQSGQSLTEFLIVALLLLLPLFLLIPTLGSMMSQKQDIEIASRYAAWERTAWNRDAPSMPGGGDTVKTDRRIAREIDARFFASDTEIIVSDEVTGVRLDPFARLIDSGESLLRDQTGADDSPAEYTIHHATQSEPPGLTGSSDDAFAAFATLTRFDLPREGLIEAEVAVELADLTRLFRLADLAMDGLRLSRSNALFVEGWTGGNKAQVEYLISGLTPQQVLDSSGFAAIQSAAATQPYGQELSPDILKFGHADIDPLPPYRIGPSVPSP